MNLRLFGAFYFAMRQQTYIPTLCVTDYKSGQRVHYASKGYAFQMTVRGRWKHVLTMTNMLEGFDAGIQHTARMLNEKWRVVELATGKIVKTNAHPVYQGESYVISEEVRNMGKLWID